MLLLDKKCEEMVLLSLLLVLEKHTLLLSYKYYKDCLNYYCVLVILLYYYVVKLIQYGLGLVASLSIHCCNTQKGIDPETNNDWLA